eukprot:571678-Heterocapsa_arctica.AAC.1
MLCRAVESSEGFLYPCERLVVLVHQDGRWGLGRREGQFGGRPAVGSLAGDPRCGCEDSDKVAYLLQGNMNPGGVALRAGDGGDLLG